MLFFSQNRAIAMLLCLSEQTRGLHSPLGARRTRKRLSARSATRGARRSTLDVGRATLAARSSTSYPPPSRAAALAPRRQAAGIGTSRVAAVGKDVNQGWYFLALNGGTAAASEGGSKGPVDRRRKDVAPPRMPSQLRRAPQQHWHRLSLISGQTAYEGQRLTAPPATHFTANHYETPSTRPRQLVVVCPLARLSSLQADTILDVCPRMRPPRAVQRRDKGSINAQDVSMVQRPIVRHHLELPLICGGCGHQIRISKELISGNSITSFAHNACHRCFHRL